MVWQRFYVFETDLPVQGKGLMVMLFHLQRSEMMRTELLCLAPTHMGISLLWGKKIYFMVPCGPAVLNNRLISW